MIRDPVLKKLHQPTMVKAGEELADIRVEHPTHIPPSYSDRERVQRMMRAASRPEPVGETQEIHLVDGVEYLDDGPLENLVFQRGDAQRSLPPVRLRDIRPAWAASLQTAYAPSVPRAVERYFTTTPYTRADGPQLSLQRCPDRRIST